MTTTTLAYSFDILTLLSVSSQRKKLHLPSPSEFDLWVSSTSCFHANANKNEDIRRDKKQKQSFKDTESLTHSLLFCTLISTIYRPLFTELIILYSEIPGIKLVIIRKPGA